MSMCASAKRNAQAPSRSQTKSGAHSRGRDLGFSLDPELHAGHAAGASQGLLRHFSMGAARCRRARDVGPSPGRNRRCGLESRPAPCLCVSDGAAIVPGCKPGGFGLRRFESSLAHQTEDAEPRACLAPSGHKSNRRDFAGGRETSTFTSSTPGSQKLAPASKRASRWSITSNVGPETPSETALTGGLVTGERRGECAVSGRNVPSNPGNAHPATWPVTPSSRSSHPVLRRRETTVAGFFWDGVSGGSRPAPASRDEGRQRLG